MNDPRLNLQLCGLRSQWNGKGPRTPKRLLLTIGLMSCCACAGAQAQPQTAPPSAAAKSSDAEEPTARDMARNLQNLRSEFADVSDAARDALGQTRRQAAEALDKAANDPNPEPSERARRILDRIINAYVESLANSEGKVADLAEAELLELGRRAVDALEKAAGGPNSASKKRARRALEKIMAHTYLIVGATDEPIRGGKLEVTLQSHEKVVVTTDDRGRVSIVTGPGRDFSSTPALFSHPEYGTVEGPTFFNGPTKKLAVPLVKQGTPAYGRALKGVVVGPDYRPLAAARITGRSVRIGGDQLIQDFGAMTVLTDAKGSFALYPPEGQSGRQGLQAKELVPANAQYLIVVTVPSDKSLFPYLAQHSNAEVAKIKIERPERFHKFKFEKRDGGFLEDPDEIRRIYLDYAGPSAVNGTVQLPPHYVLEGGRVPSGSYYAVYADGHGATWSYLPSPLEVKPDSPEELVFAFPRAMTFSGTVTHGATGKPLPGAFVFSYNTHSETSLVTLTAEEWKRLHDLPANPRSDDPALALLTGPYAGRNVTRTDANGRYEILQEPEDKTFGIMAVDEGYLPIQYVNFFKADGTDHKEMDLVLFPAAKVRIRPVLPDAKNPFGAGWRLEPQGQPEWFPRFREALNAGRFCDWGHRLTSEEPQSMFVPAGVHLRIAVGGSGPWSLRRTEPFWLEQGETKDLGKIELLSAFQLTVEVVDARGKPVEGALVRRQADDEWSVPYLTGANGRTSIYVNRESKGRFRVQLGPRETAFKNGAADASVAYEVGSEPPKEAAFKIVLTDEQLPLVSKTER